MRMKKLLILFAIALLILGTACGKKKTEDTVSTAESVTSLSASKTETSTSVVKESTKADEYIKSAEKTEYSSSDASDILLYGEFEVPYDIINVMPQKYTEDDFGTYSGDKQFFNPVGPDYFLGCFEDSKTLLYSFDYTGNPVDIKGRVVYYTRSELLKENADKNLTEGEYNDEGYTFYGNVLYYKMDDKGLGALAHSENKYELMKIATNQLWKDGVYYFSIPYKPADDSMYQDIFNENVYVENTEEPINDNSIYALLTGIMNAANTDRNTYNDYFTADVSKSLIDKFYGIKYRSPSEFEHYEVIVAAQEENLCFASILFYNIPADYPQSKVDSYIFGALLEYNEDDNKLRLKKNTVVGSDIEGLFRENTLTGYCYEAYNLGLFYTTFWIPFDMNHYVGYDGIMYGKPIEAFCDENGYLYISIYFVNETDEIMYIPEITELTVNCEYGELFSVSSPLNISLEAHSATVQYIAIPPEYMNYSGVSNLSIASFDFKFE